MSDLVRIAVDGRHGDDFAQNRPLHADQTSLALVPTRVRPLPLEHVQHLTSCLARIERSRRQ